MVRRFVFGVYDTVDEAKLVYDGLIQKGIPASGIKVTGDEKVLEDYSAESFDPDETPSELTSGVLPGASGSDAAALNTNLTGGYGGFVIMDTEDAHMQNEVDLTSYKKDIKDGKVLVVVDETYEGDALSLDVSKLRETATDDTAAEKATDFEADTYETNEAVTPEFENETYEADRATDPEFETETYVADTDVVEAPADDVEITRDNEVVYDTTNDVKVTEDRGVYRAEEVINAADEVLYDTADDVPVMPDEEAVPTDEVATDEVVDEKLTDEEARNQSRFVTLGRDGDRSTIDSLKDGEQYGHAGKKYDGKYNSTARTVSTRGINTVKPNDPPETRYDRPDEEA